MTVSDVQTLAREWIARVVARRAVRVHTDTGIDTAGSNGNTCTRTLHDIREDVVAHVAVALTLRRLIGVPVAVEVIPTLLTV